jgi:hypothetical protein
VRSGFPERSCSIKNLKRDDDSTQSHRALAGAARRARGHRCFSEHP